MSLRKRRRKGDGTLFRRADGLWVAGIEVRDPDGNRRQIRRYAKTRTDARKLLDILINDCGRPELGQD